MGCVCFLVMYMLECWDEDGMNVALVNFIGSWRSSDILVGGSFRKV